MNDLEKLLAQTTGAPPCGPNLEYDDAFRELNEAARGRPEQRIDEKNVIPGQEPRWPEVREAAQALLLRTKDLRVAVLLARALVRTEGVAALEAALRLVSGLLERYWDQVHPVLDPEDNLDPTVRLNILAQLNDPGGFVRDLRDCVFVTPRGMRPVTVRDVEVVTGRLPVKDAASALTADQLNAMLKEAAAADAASVPVIEPAAQLLQAMRRLLAGKIGVEKAPDFQVLLGTIAALQQARKGAGIDELVAPAAAEGGAAAGPRPSAPPPVPSEVRSRQDAIMLLDKVCEYLERHEPTNPAPLFIRRAKKLMTKNFVDILRDLAPNSVQDVQRMAGLDKE
jgi:type VI secretion system protein ImpA